MGFPNASKYDRFMLKSSSREQLPAAPWNSKSDIWISGEDRRMVITT